MTRTDELLTAIAAEPCPARLDGIEDEVMQRYRRRVEARSMRRSLAMAGLIAVAIGGGSALMPPSRAFAAPPLLGVPSDAPSSLLAP